MLVPQYRPGRVLLRNGVVCLRAWERSFQFTVQWRRKRSMNGMEMDQLGPQNFLYGCELKAGKDVTFNPEDDDFEHQLSLRMVCVDSSTKDELHVVEVEGHNSEGQEVKAILATLNPSSLPSVCLGGFEISPPAVFRLKSGSGPVHISGQHLIMADADQSFDEDDDDEEEEEEVVKTSTKRLALPSVAKPQKKMKMDEEADEEDDDEDDEDEDDDDEGSEDEEEEEEDSPVKPKKTPAKSPAQNGKTPNTTTPTGKQNKGKTPDAKVRTEKGTPKTPQTPRSPPTMEEIQNKIKANIEKGVMLPKVEAKFENYIKNGFHVKDSKMIQELWKWRQTVKDRK